MYEIASDFDFELIWSRPQLSGPSQTQLGRCSGTPVCPSPPDLGGRFHKNSSHTLILCFARFVKDRKAKSQ